MILKPRLFLAFERHAVVRGLAFLHPCVIEIARRFALAIGRRHRRAALERVGIIQLVPVTIRLIERQLKRVAVLLRQQLVVHGVARHGDGRGRHGGGLRRFVCVGQRLQLFQPCAVVVLLRLPEMPEQPQPGRQGHAAHRNHHYNRKNQRGGNLFLHNRLLSSHDAVKHLRLLPLRNVQTGEMSVQTVLDVFIPIHVLLLLPARREAVHTPFSVSC